MPIKEVEEFLSNCYNINVVLKNIEENKIEANYFVSLILTIKEVKENEILFHYKVNDLLNLLVEGIHFFLEKELGSIPIEWNSKTSEVSVDLKKVPALSNFLNFFYVSELRFVNENIVLILHTKSK